MKISKLMCVAVAGVMLMSGCSAGKGAVAVKIGDSNITEGTVQFASEYAINSTDAGIIVDNLKRSYIIKEVADKMNITLSEDENKQIKSSIASFKANAGGKTEGEKILKEYGLDDTILETIMAESVYTNGIMNEITIEEPSDEEMRQYFKDSYLRAKHVLISTQDQATGAEFDEAKSAEAEQKANDILKRAQGGEDFDALITEANEDPGMASNTEGYFFTDGEMVKEFEDTTKSLQPGGIGICKSDFGYHIIKRLPIDETQEMFEKFYTDTEMAIQSGMSANKQEDAIEKKAEELGIIIEVNQDVIDSIVIEPKTATTAQ